MLILPGRIINIHYTATSGPTKPSCKLSCRETRPPAPQMLPKSGRNRTERGSEMAQNGEGCAMAQNGEGSKIAQDCEGCEMACYNIGIWAHPYER